MNYPGAVKSKPKVIDCTYENEAFIKLLREYPDICSEVLQDYGITLDEMYEGFYENTGKFPDGY